MNDAFAILGLPRDADERAIKRAYAALLRVHRPDEDPVGFQRINEAYQSALQWRQWRDSLPPDIDVDADDDDGIDDVIGGDDAPDDAAGGQPARHEPAVVEHGDAPIRIRVTDAVVDPDWDGDGYDTPEALAADAAGPVPPPLPPVETRAHGEAEGNPVSSALAIAGKGDVDALAAWLRAEPAFWSLREKAWWGDQLLYALQESPVAMPGECFDALMGFFGLDDVHAARHHVHLDWLRHRCVQWWVLKPRRPTRPLSRVQLAAQASERANLERLQGPFRWRRVLWDALRPGVPDGMAAFVASLGHWRAEDLPPNVDARTLAFWRDARAEVPALTRARFAVFAARTSVAGLLFAMMALLGGLQDPAVHAWAVLATVVMGYLWVASLAGMWLVCTTYFRWEPVRWPMEWPGWVVPLLAVACLLVLYAAGNRGTGEWLACATLFLQGWREVYRWLLSRPGTINATVWVAFAACVVVVTLMQQWLEAEVMLAIALIRWGKMTWGIRRRFRPA